MIQKQQWIKKVQWYYLPYGTMPIAKGMFCIQDGSGLFAGLRSPLTYMAIWLYKYFRLTCTTKIKGFQIEFTPMPQHLSQECRNAECKWKTDRL